MSDIWVCKKCCSQDIEEKVWVQSNSYNGNMAKVMSDCDSNFWCPECEADYGVCTYDEFGVEDDTEQLENSRLNQIMNDADKSMNKLNERNDK